MNTCEMCDFLITDENSRLKPLPCLDGIHNRPFKACISCIPKTCSCGGDKMLIVLYGPNGLRNGPGINFYDSLIYLCNENCNCDKRYSDHRDSHTLCRICYECDDVISYPEEEDDSLDIKTPEFD